MGCFKRIYKIVPRKFRAFAVMFLTLLCLSMFVIPAYFQYRREGLKNTATKAQFNISGSGSLWGKDQISVYLNVISVNVPTPEIQMIARVVPGGIYGSTDEDRNSGQLAADLPGPLQLVIGENGIYNFTAGQTIPALRFTLPLFEGDVNDYPFDVFQGAGFIKAQIQSQRIPIGLDVDAAIPNWIIVPQIQVMDSTQTALLRLTAARSSTSKAFAIFIVILMWLLSLSAFGVAVDALIRKLDVHPPILASVIGLIFALPQLRRAIPGVPEVGVGIDILGFFWNMAITGMAALMMITMYILRYKDPKLSQVYSDIETQEVSYGPSRLKHQSYATFISKNEDTDHWAQQEVQLSSKMMNRSSSHSSESSATKRNSVSTIGSETSEEMVIHSGTSSVASSNPSAVKNAKFTFTTPTDEYMKRISQV